MVFIHYFASFDILFQNFVAILNSNIYTQYVGIYNYVYCVCIKETTIGANQIGTGLEVMPKNVETS